MSTANDSDGGIIDSGFSIAPAVVSSTANDGNIGDRKTVSTTNDSDGGIIVSGFSFAPAVVSSTADDGKEEDDNFWQPMDQHHENVGPRTWCLYEAYHDHLLRPPAKPPPGRLKHGLQTRGLETRRRP